MGNSPRALKVQLHAGAKPNAIESCGPPDGMTQALVDLCSITSMRRMLSAVQDGWPGVLSAHCRTGLVRLSTRDRSAAFLHRRIWAFPSQDQLHARD